MAQRAWACSRPPSSAARAGRTQAAPSMCPRSPRGRYQASSPGQRPVPGPSTAPSVMQARMPSRTLASRSREVSSSLESCVKASTEGPAKASARAARPNVRTSFEALTPESSAARVCNCRTRRTLKCASSVSRRRPSASRLITRATTSMVPRAIMFSWLSTANCQRGGTKKKLNAMTAPTAQTADFNQSSR